MTETFDPDQTTIVPYHVTIWTPEQLEELAKLAITLRNAKAAHEEATSKYEHAQSEVARVSTALSNAQKTLDTYVSKQLVGVEL